tara:strand:+ start:221 stop:583 length:363 start_codon:yes stop_codon:yes gene_type:complete
MKLKLLLKILSGFMILFTLGGILAPEEMMKSFGMSYTKEAAVILPFALMGQIFFIILTLQISNWVEDLTKVSMTYACLVSLPILLNLYQAFSGVVPLTTAFYVEQLIWGTFVILFLKTKK